MYQPVIKSPSKAQVKTAVQMQKQFQKRSGELLKKRAAMGAATKRMMPTYGN